jgi:FkbH-like protein
MEEQERKQAARILYRVGRAIRSNRERLAMDLFDAVRECQGISPGSPRTFSELDDWNQQVLYTAIDLAVDWLSKAAESSKLLFQGWLHSELKLPMLEFQDPLSYQPRDILIRVKKTWISRLRESLSASDTHEFERELDRIIADFSQPIKRNVRLLLISDCLKWEILTSLVGPCTEASINVTHEEIGERILPVIRNQIRALDPTQFDLVFFSPFTHQFFTQYAQLLKWESAFWSRARFCSEIDELLNGVILTLRALVQHFQCPIYVHNTAGTVQIFNPISGLVKETSARFSRSAVRSIINRRLKEASAEAHWAGQIRVLDEDELNKDFSPWELGKVSFKGRIFHPTRIGVELGQRSYFNAVFSSAYLSTKKVVVCDLDNTLWDGVIGEGAVTHFSERQQILKRLRERGVLLSINSKNDQANVHFRGGVLQLDDFVAPRINWLPKAENMAGIAKELNLNVKDFVFIDDRPDELERMRNAFPDIVALNACQPNTWKLLSHWGSHLLSDLKEDRTKLYQERVARENFLSKQSSIEEAAEDESAAYHELQISVKLENVDRNGLKRVVELINRTNQFNLCGSRTTLRDEEDGLGSEHWIITASAKDKFGAMGVVGAMRVNRKAERIEIPIFVLSCRVFGFGIEYALLNSVKQLGPADYPVVGWYKETQANTPGRQLYARGGLTWDGENWIGKVSDLTPPPVWLTIENAVPSQVASKALIL